MHAQATQPSPVTRSIIPSSRDEQRREEAIRESRGRVRSIKGELMGLRQMLDDIIARVDDDDIAPDEDVEQED